MTHNVLRAAVCAALVIGTSLVAAGAFAQKAPPAPVLSGGGRQLNLNNGRAVANEAITRVSVRATRTSLGTKYGVLIDGTSSWCNVTTASLGDADALATRILDARTIVVQCRSDRAAILSQISVDLTAGTTSEEVSIGVRP
jgi:hypothetical protein